MLNWPESDHLQIGHKAIFDSNDLGVGTFCLEKQAFLTDNKPCSSGQSQSKPGNYSKTSFGNLTVFF